MEEVLIDYLKERQGCRDIKIKTLEDLENNYIQVCYEVIRKDNSYLSNEMINLLELINFAYLKTSKE